MGLPIVVSVKVKVAAWDIAAVSRTNDSKLVLATCFHRLSEEFDTNDLSGIVLMCDCKAIYMPVVQVVDFMLI